MYYNYPHQNDGDRIFFFPFLGPLILGGIGGYALGGASRPRPVYVNPPYNPYPPRPYTYNQFGGYNYY